MGEGYKFSGYAGWPGLVGMVAGVLVIPAAQLALLSSVSEKDAG